ncbi:hypothetical protein Htur_5052 (plasmid) [Haloterrigena turkmenica DSM 5511]|uniref:Uncharacterized protein n=1 Tax=Haloterrigena turkmenica (strain ATCC 51198 / DSM 5511 / JCM 9101 / NCIMB 13204 / VKM B-1734 / 4k) TaxID=543526 RepID=D2S3J2_HALTV|nr:hypothetical protein [Haloterrigena turkmenica]ADB63939.1 hypothetical protein Htur_5052 [Haloterrigena turkmenica DSM 5511]
MTDAPIDRFDASAPDTATMTVNGREYEFRADDLPALKAIFDDLEIEGAEVPEAEWSAEGFRETLEGDK